MLPTVALNGVPTKPWFEDLPPSRLLPRGGDAIADADAAKGRRIAGVAAGLRNSKRRGERRRMPYRVADGADADIFALDEQLAAARRAAATAKGIRSIEWGRWPGRVDGDERRGI